MTPSYEQLERHANTLTVLLAAEQQASERLRARVAGLAASRRYWRHKYAASRRAWKRERAALERRVADADSVADWWRRSAWGETRVSSKVGRRASFAAVVSPVESPAGRTPPVKSAVADNHRKEST